jgi:hypothetical protein
LTLISPTPPICTLPVVPFVAGARASIRATAASPAERCSSSTGSLLRSGREGETGVRPASRRRRSVSHSGISRRPYPNQAAISAFALVRMSRFAFPARESLLIESSGGAAS